MIFKSDLKFIENLNVIPDQNNFPQLYRADFNFAKAQQNITLDNILTQIEKLFKNDGYQHTTIDTRTHMLMTGMYPCIPGWHCDDFYRPTNEQPDLENVLEKANQTHYLVLLGDCSLTEFLSEDISLPKPLNLPKENPVYYYYDEIIEEGVSPSKIVVEPNKIYSFGPLCFHRGMPATKNGWRTFIRITRSNHIKPENQTRYQSNVYVKGRISW